MASDIDDIKEQEENIFEDLSFNDSSSLNDASLGDLYPAGESAQVVSSTVRNQARKQLAVSEDSPFSHIGQVDDPAHLRRLRAASLRKETDEIKRQLDIVKSRLAELKENRLPEGETPRHIDSSPRIGLRRKLGDVQQPLPYYPYQVQETARQRHTNNRLIKHPEPKFRPLTGQADCPNCTCDRRSSVCDRCISIATIKPTADRSLVGQVASIEPKKVTYQDDRPIKPAKAARSPDETNEAVVDGAIVPNRVFTISRSLNDKRTKLAQAIDELHLMMDQVKEKGNKLEQERKLVQLYKDQWKFGPTIGGPIASARDRLGVGKGQQQQQRRNYESRLDPNLRRDSKSLMGFQHVGAGMRLRSYDGTDNMRQLIKKKSVTNNEAKQLLHSRSKSMESLSSKMTAKNPANISEGNQNRDLASESRSASELALNKAADKTDDRDEELDEVAEELEEEIRDDTNNGRSNEERLPSRVSPPAEVTIESDSIEGDTSRSERVQRMKWIPVFGETEIKTIKRNLPKRKIQIVTPPSSQESDVNRSSPMRNNVSMKPLSTNHSGGSGKVIKINIHHQKTNDTSFNKGSDRVMVEAQRKLKACSGLLEQEKHDAVNKNQLVVNRPIIKPTPRPRQAPKPQPARVTNYHEQSAEARAGDASPREANVQIGVDTSREMARLEEMVNEQQRLLSRLAQSQERSLVSPITVSCSSPCCHHHVSPTSKASGSSASHRLISNPSNSRSLIGTLRDRLNKSKMRLARTLEEEREKHQLLKQKVDFSLKKQSDLENENELLKQSLSKCIDTCLKDISNTFESLSDTLTDSINGMSSSGRHLPGDGDALLAGSEVGGVALTNAAKLMADNRHLKQMRGHIETIESQRKAIFDELSKEKQRSNQLESQLRNSQDELKQLLETKQKLESRLEFVNDKQSESPPLSNSRQKADQQNDDGTTTKQSAQSNLSSQTETTDRSDMDDTYNSVDIYRRYIQSMSPDLESLKRERMVIISEFDNIKKMLSDIDK